MLTTPRLVKHLFPESPLDSGAEFLMTPCMRPLCVLKLRTPCFLPQIPYAVTTH
jgi:hypothetical protein